MEDKLNRIISLLEMVLSEIKSEDKKVFETPPSNIQVYCMVYEEFFVYSLVKGGVRYTDVLRVKHPDIAVKWLYGLSAILESKLYQEVHSIVRLYTYNGINNYKEEFFSSSQKEYLDKFIACFSVFKALYIENLTEKNDIFNEMEKEFCNAFAEVQNERKIN